MVNLQGSIYTKQGSLIENFNLSTFFHTGSEFISDPKVLYDAPSGRWFATILNLVSNSSNIISGNVTIAVSTGSDPTDMVNGWKFYPLADANHLPDQPILGINNDKVVVSVNDYNSRLTAFLGAHYWVLNKADLIAGTASPRSNSFGPFPTLESLHPVQSTSSTATEYMVSTGASDIAHNGNTVQVVAITGVPPGTVGNQTVSLSIPTYLIAPGASQPAPLGSLSPSLDTGDQRVLDATWYQGKLWLGFDDQCNPTGNYQAWQACIRLVQIDTSQSTVKQNIDLADAYVDYFYPAFRIDSAGNLAIVYAISSYAMNIYPSIAISGQGASDQPNTLRQRETIKSGNAVGYEGRYGDYFGAAIDPSDTTLVWVAGEYHANAVTGRCGSFFSGTTSCWTTWIDNMRVSGLGPISSPLVFTQTMTFSPQAATATISGNFTVNSTLKRTFYGLVTATSSNTTTGGNIYSNLLGISEVYGDSGTVRFLIDLPTSTIWLAIICDVNVYSNSASCFLVRTPDYDHDGFIDQSDASFVISHYGTTPSSSNWDPRADLDGSGVVDIIDVGIVSASANKDLFLPVLTSNSNPPAITVQAGNSGVSNITFTSPSYQGAGTASFTATVYPTPASAPSCTLNPTSLFIPSGGSAKTQLTCSTSSATPALNYTITVTATNGALKDSAPVILRIANFNIAASPTSLSIPKGSSGTSTITLSSLNRFSGTTSLTATISPVVNKGPTVTLSTATVTIAAGGQGTSLLTVTTTSNTPRGTYSITVTATSGSTVQTTTVTVTVS
jgi:hypothetical protein